MRNNISHRERKQSGRVWKLNCVHVRAPMANFLLHDATARRLLRTCILKFPIRKVITNEKSGVRCLESLMARIAQPKSSCNNTPHVAMAKNLENADIYPTPPVGDAADFHHQRPTTDGGPSDFPLADEENPKIARCFFSIESNK